MTSTPLAVKAPASAPPPPAPPRGLKQLLTTHLRPYHRNIVIVLALQVIQTLTSLYLPTLNGDIINNGVIKGDTGYILVTGAAMLVVTLLQVGCAVATVYFAARTALGLGRDVRAAVFARVQSFSVRDMGRFGAASLITRTTNDVEQVQMLVLMALTVMVTAPAMGLGGIVMAVNLDVPMSGLLVILLPAMTAILVVLLRFMIPLSRSMQERIDTLNRVVREQVTGIRVVRAFVREDHEQRRFAKAGDDLLGVATRLGRIQAFMMPVVMLAMEVSMMAVNWVGAHRADSGNLEIGSLMAFGSYVMQILIGVMMATFAFAMAPRAQVCAQRVQEILDTRPSLAAPATPASPERIDGHLEIRDVGFGYPEAAEPVLQSVSLTAQPGQTTAIIGSTGSGKTTLVNLIPRLFDPDTGSVRIDGIDVRDLAPRSLVGTIGLVPQKPYLFSGTIASNLRYGKPDASDGELWHALEVAQARDFVAAMPEGLNAHIGQGGTNVSGGQRQRLAIARAVVARPRVYVFDDSFSALDYTTDAALRAALAAETGDAAVIIVAQRIATIREADRIVVMDAGRVVGTGTHHELMAGNATYRQIVLSQRSEQEAT